MYKSRKATAVFQHTNPLKEERFMKEWQVSKQSPLTKVYTQYSTWRKTSTAILGLRVPPFTLHLPWGRRRQGQQGFPPPMLMPGQLLPTNQRPECSPEATGQSVRVITHDNCTLTLLAWLQLSVALNSVNQATANGLARLLEPVVGDRRRHTGISPR